VEGENDPLRAPAPEGAATAEQDQRSHGTAAVGTIASALPHQSGRHECLGVHDF
jgi:hypothetical protein